MPMQFVAAEILSAMTDIARYNTPHLAERRLALVERAALTILNETNTVTNTALAAMPAKQRSEFLTRIGQRLATLQKLVEQLQAAGRTAKRAA
jgi:hypothetical protein